MKFSIFYSFLFDFVSSEFAFLRFFSQHRSTSIWIAIADDKRYSNKLVESEWRKEPLFVDLIPGYHRCYWFLWKSSYSTCRNRDEASHNNKKYRFETIFIHSLYNTSFCGVNDATRHFSEIISIKLNYKPFESVRRWAQIYATHRRERERKKVSCSPLTGEWWSLISHFCLHGQKKRIPMKCKHFFAIKLAT